ncbi:hypothetical protein WG66_004733 [Moniliophthora roreri]|nr:hypothetical protein WG66_004733 [Moniliophthora roreri]
MSSVSNTMSSTSRCELEDSKSTQIMLIILRLRDINCSLRC